MRTKLLSKIANLVVRYPWKIILTSGLLTVISIFLTFTILEMNTDQDDLVSEKIEYHRRYKDYLKEFGDLEYLYVVVETNGNLSRAKDFIMTLSKRLEALPDVQEVTYQISNPKLEKSFLLYLPKERIETIGEYLPRLERLNNVGGVFSMMNAEIERMGKEGPAKTSYLETGFRFLDNLMDGLISAGKDNAPYRPFLQSAFFAGDRAYDEDGFLLSENGRLLFVMIMPEKNYKTLAVIEEPLKNIRSVIDDVKKEFPDVKAGLTGRPVLAADEMRISDTDMTIATIAAIIIVTLIFVAYFKRPTRPAFAAIALSFGILQTFGFTAITIGHLNILSIVFAVILVGAGIEFGLQIVSRYREELSIHKNPKLAVEICITQTGKGNLTACATTAAAFFSMCFTNFLALQELGFIAGFGILLCLANMFTALPAMMYLNDRHKHPERLNISLAMNLKPFLWFYKRPKGVLITAAIVTIALSFGLLRLGFNHNLLDLQARGLESVEYEKKILSESTQSTWYVPFILSNAEDSNITADKLKKLSTVGKVETIADVVPENQPEKMAIIKKIASSFNNSASTAKTGVPLKTELERFGTNIANLIEMAFSSGNVEAVKELENISKKTDELLQLLTGHETRIENYENAFLKDIHRHVDLFKGALSPETITIEDMPVSIQKRYISPETKRLALYAYPKDDIWDPAKMSAFINQIRSVDPLVTGTPVEVFESSKLLEDSFKRAAFFALLAILIIVSVDFRNFKFSSLGILPLSLGILWLFELMGIFDIRFNLANFFGIPILLGIGIDNAVQITHRFLKDGRSETIESFMTRATGTAVLLTSLTTFVSFGTLIFARHQGIASMGLIMSLGTLTCFIGSMIILPCALILVKRSAK